MRLIDADALLSGFDVRKVTEYDESGCGVDYKAVPVKVIENAPTVEHYGSIDISANAVFDSATKEKYLRFREIDEMCPRCQRDLEVYYCENRTYIVRCKHCNIVSIVSAANPHEAAAKVGLHIKPVRHGRWIPKTYSISECSACKQLHFAHVDSWNYCPNCGAKMDKEDSK